MMVLAGMGCGTTDKPAGETKPKIILGDYSWDSALVHNRIAGFIIEKGYGYPVDYTFGESMIILQGLERGDIDISMETWVDNIREAYAKMIASGNVKDLGDNFADARQGWYVPAYVIKGDPERGIEPMAPDLKKVTDLAKYWELFKDPEEPGKGRFYNSPAGWVVTSINEKKMEAYGLSKYYNVFSSGSDAALATSIASAYEKGKPWLGYYWEPTWIMGKYDMIKLEEPVYDEKVWEKDYGCDFPPSKVTITINSGLEEKAPEVVEFLKNYETTLKQNNAVLAYMQDNGGGKEGAEKAALWFFEQYPDTWKAWLPADVAAKVEKALKEMK
ncbi:MAG: ABC transporter substrate-binding protein [Thermosyntropha sp.]|nr:ABC transporter substrate-binding protein [Thermosyntropha sp.]